MEQGKKKSNKKKAVTDNLCGLSELQFKEIYKFLVFYSQTQNSISGITQAIFSLLLKHNNDWIFTDNDASIYKMMWGANDASKIFRNSDNITKYLIPKKTAAGLKETADVILIDLNYDSGSKAELLDNILTSHENELNVIFNINGSDLSGMSILNPAVLNIVQVDGNNFFDSFNKIRTAINSFKRGNKPLVILNNTFENSALDNFEEYLKEHKILSKKEIDSIKEEITNEGITSDNGINAYELSGESDELLVIVIGKSKLTDEVQNLYNDSLKFNLLTIIDIADINQSLICGSVNKCGKVLIVYEHKELSIISDRVLRMVIENCFEDLDAPVKTINSNDVSEVKERIKKLLEY